MAVEKYRSAEEMNAAPVRAGRGDGFERFVRQCARIRKLAARKFVRGVVKFRSFDEAQATPAQISKD
jgi:hypothetical protein